MKKKNTSKRREDFLKQIRSDQRIIELNTDSYLIKAVPFYNYANENDFNQSLEKVLK